MPRNSGQQANSKSEPDLDDDTGSPVAARGRSGSKGQSASDSFAEVSRFDEDFETGIETDAFDDKWISGGTLPEIPNRPGFVQRWINTEDRTNIANQLRRGWTFRKAETLPEGFKATPTIQHGEHSGFIGVNGQVLAEMPVALHIRHQEHQRAETRKLEQAVESDLYRVRGPGMAATQKESTTRVSVGRVPNIPDDAE